MVQNGCAWLPGPLFEQLDAVLFTYHVVVAADATAAGSAAAPRTAAAVTRQRAVLM
jgi:hypothetical protein